MHVLVALDLSERELSGGPAIQPGLTGECPQATFVAQLFATCRSRNLAEQRCLQDMASVRYTSASASSPASRERPVLDRSI